MRDLIVVVVLVAVLAGVLLVASKVPVREQNTTPTSENTMTNTLGIEIVEEGTGDTARAGDTVFVHYTGTFIDGTKFDSSIDRGEPISFTLGEGRVIAGWEQGILGMKVGEKRRLTIPPELGYGEDGYGAIPGDTTLLFDVELVAIEQRGA